MKLLNEMKEQSIFMTIEARWINNEKSIQKKTPNVSVFNGHNSKEVQMEPYLFLEELHMLILKNNMKRLVKEEKEEWRAIALQEMQRRGGFSAKSAIRAR